MGKCLVMLTSAYPYLSNQESFIESEIKYLSDVYEKIIILAIDLDPDAQMERIVPENVECYNVSPKSKKVGRLSDIILGAKNSFKNAEYYLEEKEKVNGDYKKRLFLEYFIHRSYREYEYCKNVIEKYDFSQYDSVTIYSYWFFVTAYIGSLIKKEVIKQCPKTELISRAHRYDIYEEANSLGYIPMRKYLLGEVDKVFPCSTDGEEHIRKENPEYAEKICHAYLGSRDFGLSSKSENGFHIVSCSHVVPVKRVEKIVEALSLLSDKNITNLKWTHIGDGSKMKYVRKLANEKLNFMQVEFTGSLSNSDVCDFYRNNSVDLFINTSSNEGVPVSIMEAISTTVPVICTDVGGTSEIIEDGKNGWLIRPDFSSEELAEKIFSVYRMNADDYIKIRNTSREKWKEKFDADRNYKEFSAYISSGVKSSVGMER